MRNGRDRCFVANPQLRPSLYRLTQVRLGLNLPLTAVFLAAISAWAVSPVQAPAGTELHVRLKSTLSSNTTKVKDAIEAVVVTPVVVNGIVAIRAGTLVRGQVSAVQSASRADQRATLGLAFTEIVGASGKKFTLKALLVNVDNARETVNETGQVVGILASETLAARIDQGIGKVAQRNTALADILEVAKGAVLKQQPSGEIRYEPGVELQLRLLEPLRFDDSGPAEPTPSGIKDEVKLRELVNSQPFQTVAENPPKPSDITNLMFIATEEQLRKAFEVAGWVLAQEINTGSILETIAAVAEMRGYKEAPMSRLLLEGKRSDFDYQKGNNTFAKRHHLRIWRRPNLFEGKPVWVSSSTHDIAIDFSQENRTFIHRIDPKIDRERAKVVADLLFTNLVGSLALVERSQVPKRSQNATGDNIETDGQMAVMLFR